MVSIKEKIEEIVATLIIWLMIMWDDIKETLITVAVMCVVASLLTNFFFQPVRVTGTSMYPTLKDGEVGFSSIVARRTGKIRRFDIVVIRLKERGEDLVKRVI
ncbi:MAG: signal peptidase I, partial [Erysipelotrichaceae bacterium]|nr:signal peptidase I [Erysipelotrichaceae bacterium]